jgi:hypothetical protein
VAVGDGGLRTAALDKYRPEAPDCVDLGDFEGRTSPAGPRKSELPLTM